ncbi:LuxR C-terminal-related transcriptional regulator [Umezawaea sp. NPDC059074]|uniref:LuxR C-terminal-related transcriptional regulator n=1 Tax=Umezawaea sp. NPDC059074 TaxID=3346716 RepID=UPI00368052FB
MAELPGRAAELAAVDDLLATGGAGLAWRGPAGVGKTALLRLAADRASAAGRRVLAVEGTEAERGLALAGVHRLVHAARHDLTGLMGHPRAVLDAVLGRFPGAPPDVMAVASAVLGLLERVAADGPVLVVVDDVDLLDRASATVLGFVVRRCRDLRVTVVTAARSEVDWGLHTAALDVLSEVDARTVVADLPPTLRRRVLAEAGGLPLALVEYTAAVRGLPAEPVVLPVTGKLAAVFAELAGEVRTPDDVRAVLGTGGAHPLARTALVRALADGDRGELRAVAAHWSWLDGRLDEAGRLAEPEARAHYLAYRDGGFTVGRLDAEVFLGRAAPGGDGPFAELRAAVAGEPHPRPADSASPLHAMIAAVTAALDRTDAGALSEAEDLAARAVSLSEPRGYRAVASLARAVAAVGAAVRGQGQRAAELSAAALGWADPAGAHAVTGLAHHARLLTALGRGDYDRAHAHACLVPADGLLGGRVLLDAVEASVHTGRTADALRRIADTRADERTTSAATALVSDDPRRHFEAALAAPGRKPFEDGRIRLLYGQWLRRRTRDVGEARRHICLALDVLDRVGAQPWADRARDELRATGLSQLGGRTPAGLTEQESRIALLAAEGLTNKQIATRLFLSPRTVGAHLYKVFPKLGISTRAELRLALEPVGLERWGA